ncbi:hypothetical protein DET48_1477 [Vibrio diazotrophicus]|uniref:Major coat protein n=1 Tax=Vibrio diazotrophicus TaxID=685 RepID=A0A329E3W0_VIBDI|nr:hypothetical protein [Vibrio diazotrophicus]RAS55256.1 hypothetical protein DET48_1477 [Vibrio diazotrophicus]
MKFMNVLKKHSVKIGAAASAVVVSGAANATVEEALSSAVSSGQGNYSTVVIGLIGLAAIGFGLRAIVGAMR